MIARVVALVLVASGAAACGGTVPGARRPDAPVTAVASTGTPGDPSGPRVVEPEEGLENPIPTAWTKATVADDGLSARLTWYSGVEECYGLDRVQVGYRDETVEITLYAGSRPEAEECIDLAEKVVTVVDFKEPVGDRELVDGALPD